MRENFTKIYSEKIKRAGSDKLFAWLEKTDFFVAPASTKYHGSYEGGLVEHCLNVYTTLTQIADKYKDKVQYSEETIAICALLHDLCKVQFYKKGFRNVKNPDTQKWEQVEVYNVEEAFPAGHGEKSVFLIQAFFPLLKEEILALRWHMGAWDSAVKGGDYSIGKAYETCPLAVMLQLADMEATYLLEQKERNDGENN